MQRTDMREVPEKSGVCIATSGPGATNLVTGIATAYMDSIPMVAITCNVGTALLGKDSFQEIDIAGVTMPITKYSLIVKDVTELADTTAPCVYDRKERKTGPGSGGYHQKMSQRQRRIQLGGAEKSKGSQRNYEKDVDTAVSMIKAAKKPYIFVGGGAVISGASEELRENLQKASMLRSVIP